MLVNHDVSLFNSLAFSFIYENLNPQISPSSIHRSLPPPLTSIALNSVSIIDRRYKITHLPLHPSFGLSIFFMGKLISFAYVLVCSSF